MDKAGKPDTKVALFPRRLREWVRVGARYTPTSGDSGTIANLYVVDEDGAAVEVDAALPVEVRAAVVQLDEGGWLVLGCAEGLIRAPAPN
jgi:hypothetical protein